MGMMVVDRTHRGLDSEGYKRFLPAFGRAENEFVGWRVEEVVPNSMMAQVVDSGQAILVDLLTNQAGTFVVSRLPLRDARARSSAHLAWCVARSSGIDDAAAAGRSAACRANFRTRRARADRGAAPVLAHDRELRRRERAGDGGQAQAVARGADRRDGASPGRD